MLKVQVPPFAAGGEMLQVVAPVWKLFEPVRLKPKTGTAEPVLRWLVIVTDMGTLLVPSAWLPNASARGGAGATVNGCTPVPVIFTVSGTVSPVPVMVRVAVCAPRPAGVAGGAN